MAWPDFSMTEYAQYVVETLLLILAFISLNRRLIPRDKDSIKKAPWAETKNDFDEKIDPHRGLS